MAQAQISVSPANLMLSRVAAITVSALCITPTTAFPGLASIPANATRPVVHAEDRTARTVSRAPLTPRSAAISVPAMQTTSGTRMLVSASMLDRAVQLV